MRVQILKNCFKPEEVRSKAPTILTRDSFVELPDDLAQQIIDKGYAAELVEKKVKPNVDTDAAVDASASKKKGKRAKEEVLSDATAA